MNICRTPIGVSIRMYPSAPPDVLMVSTSGRNYCTGQDIFANMIFSRIAENSNSRAWYVRGFPIREHIMPANWQLTIYFTFWANKSLKPYSQTWHSRKYHVRENFLSYSTQYSSSTRGHFDTTKLLSIDPDTLLYSISIVYSKNKLWVLSIGIGSNLFFKILNTYNIFI